MLQAKFEYRLGHAFQDLRFIFATNTQPPVLACIPRKVAEIIEVEDLLRNIDVEVFVSWIRHEYFSALILATGVANNC